MERAQGVTLRFGHMLEKDHAVLLRNPGKAMTARLVSLVWEAAGEG